MNRNTVKVTAKVVKIAYGNISIIAQDTSRITDFKHVKKLHLYVGVGLCYNVVVFKGGVI
ncbi:MAG: hypothetical protein AB7C97_11575 [Oscillospiraceae bacterium]